MISDCLHLHGLLSEIDQIVVVCHAVESEDVDTAAGLDLALVIQEAGHSRNSLLWCNCSLVWLMVAATTTAVSRSLWSNLSKDGLLVTKRPSITSLSLAGNSSQGNCDPIIIVHGTARTVPIATFLRIVPWVLHTLNWPKKGTHTCQAVQQSRSVDSASPYAVSVCPLFLRH